MAIQLEKQTHDFLVGSIKRFFSENLDEKIGDLKADLVLDFFIKEMAPSVYNQAIADAQSYFRDRATDLGDVRYEAEFDYWKDRKARGGVRP